MLKDSEKSILLGESMFYANKPRYWTKHLQTNSDSKEPSLINSAGEFVWSYYLNRICNKARAAPEKLFKDPFPFGKHGFKVGMKLEGIDPEHQAVISVLTVAQVKGKCK